jgi:hypothetical protein
MTHDEFDRCIKVLIAGVGRQMPAETAVVWRECLGDLEFSQLKTGVTAALRDWTFGGFPSIGFVAERCGVPKATVSEDQQAVLAWDTVLKAIRSHGGYVSVKWDDPVIPAVIEAVAQSWPALCETPSDELLRFTRPRFLEAWKALRCSGVDGRGCVSAGIVARDAGRIGGEAPTPVPVGEHQPPLIGFGKDHWKHEADRLAPRLAYEPKFVQLESGGVDSGETDADEVAAQVRSLRSILSSRFNS